MEAVLRQDIAWYDTNTTSDFASKMTEDLNKIQDGIDKTLVENSQDLPDTHNWVVTRLLFCFLYPTWFVCGLVVEFRLL